MSKKEHLIFILLLASITLLVYSDSFNNGFIWDDHSFIEENPAIKTLNIESIKSFFTNCDTTAASKWLTTDVWRPLTIASFAMDYRFWGLAARFYHVENTIIHIANAVLVYIMVFLILSNGFAAFAASLIFAIHPVQTEAVTWVSGRSNVLFLFFFLSSFIFHIRRKDAGMITNYGIALIFFALALLSKEMAIVLPLVLILYDMHYSDKKGLKYYIKHYSPFFLIALFYLMARYSVLGKISQKDAWWGGSMGSNFLTMLKALAGYVRLLILPFNLRVGYVVDVSKSLFDPDTLLAAIILSVLAVLYFSFRRKKEFSFFMLWFFVCLIPVYNIVPFKAIMAERFLYLPSIGYAALLGIMFANRRERFGANSAGRAVVTIIFIALAVFYGALTIARNMEWRNELVFCRKEVARSPDNAKFHYNLGLAYVSEAEKDPACGQTARSYYALAIKEFHEGIRLSPKFVEGYINLANVYNRVGLYDIAIGNFKKSIGIKEDYRAYNNMAVAYYEKGDYERARKNCILALQLEPDHVNAIVNLGNAYFMKREYGKALRAWEYAAKKGEIGADTIANIQDLRKNGY